MQNQNNKKTIIRRLTTTLIVILITTTLSSIAVFILANTNRNRQVLDIYGSTLWSGLQLQIQTYRFLDFLRTLEKNPEKAIDTYSHYGILMSRVDLLKMGPVSNQIHYISDGRSIRLLNIIHAEFELLNDIAIKIENNDLSQVDQMILKLQQLDAHINRLVNLINQGTQTFSVETRKQALSELYWLKCLMIIFLSNAFVLFIIMFRNFKITKESLLTVATTQEKITNLLTKKKHFLSTMGQEIRTPLNRSLSMINLLKKTKLNTEQTQILSTTEEASQSLLNLINDFLDLAKIESGNLELNYKPVNLHHEIENALYIANTNSNHKNVQLLSYIDLNLPNKVIIDQNRLQQIILNLVDNSFKFTQKGYISVIVRLSQSTLNNWRPEGYEDTLSTMIQIVIKDTGIGVPDKVTELFKIPINDESLNIPESRNGLGLSLCRFITHLMKGNIMCHTPLAGGSEFIIELPVFHTKIESINNNPTIKPVLDAVANKTMVIVEQDSSIAHIISMQANALGIQTPIYSGSLHELPEQSIDFVYITDDSMLDDMSYMNIKKLINKGTLVIANNQLSNKKTKAMAHHLYDTPLLHLNMIEVLRELSNTRDS